MLNKTGISYHKNNFSLSYKIDNLKYGADSYIYNICTKDRFFDLGVIEDYQYIGIESKFNASHFTFDVKIAANNYHTAILDNSITWKPNQNSAKIYFLFVPRNSEYNAINYSFGTEINLKNDRLRLYESFVYQYLPDHARGDKMKSLTEVVISPFANLSIGSNLFCEGFSQLGNWQFQSFIKFDYRKISNYLIFRYNYMDEFNKAEINREFTLLNQYNISKNLSILKKAELIEERREGKLMMFGIKNDNEFNRKLFDNITTIYPDSNPAFQDDYIKLDKRLALRVNGEVIVTYKK